MAHVVALPKTQSNVRYADRLKTVGHQWSCLEKKLLDLSEFLEAMILVLNDVKLQNIQCRDYAMVEIITEEIAHYQTRLEKSQAELQSLRNEYMASVQ